MTLLVVTFARFLYFIYGYEALNLLFRIMPSQIIVQVLKAFGSKVGRNVRIQAPFLIHNADREKPIFKNLMIGDDCYIGRNCMFDLHDVIDIKSSVTISHGVTLNTHTDAGKSMLANSILPQSKGAICIYSNTYIGLNVTILQGVTIGNACLIGANSLVNKTIPKNSLAFGQPCKIQKQLDV